MLWSRTETTECSELARHLYKIFDREVKKKKKKDVVCIHVGKGPATKLVGR